MADREKVIKSLKDSLANQGCGYMDGVGELYAVSGEDLQNAIALLKKQETTFEKDGHHIMCKSCGVYWCDRDLEGDQYPKNFCPNCGKVVKWE